MEEYRDGSFGEIFPVGTEESEAKLRSLLSTPEATGSLRAIHFGTVKELEAKKAAVAEASDLEVRLSRLEKLVTEVFLRLNIPTSAILVTDEMPQGGK